jgi:glyoxylase-like metal-dependent hydrolase (beta-lactamase superfamily II)
VANTFKIGNLEVLVVADGEARFPAHIYFPGTTPADMEPHKRWFDHQGNAVFPFSCFVVRSGDRRVLIDTGLGPLKMFTFTGGGLLGELAANGVKPEDIDTVFLTHLHIDHCGTAMDISGEAMKPMFPNATYRWTSAENDFWKTPNPNDPLKDQFSQADMISTLGNRLNTAEDGEEIAPGVNVISTPGHTPGHAGIILSSGTERAYVLGDAISCPAQLTETEWSGMGDFDPKLARQSQEIVAREAEESGALLTAAHFPGLTFGRVLVGEGKRYWDPVS